MKIPIFNFKLPLLLASALWFCVASAQGVISVGSGNDSGLSADNPASEPPPPNPAALSSRDGYVRLTTPVITELRRLDISRVRIKWTCEQHGFVGPGMTPVLVILRQASDGIWEPVHEQDWASAGDYTDNADITTIWRYSAITKYIDSGSLHLIDAASDAASPRELEYGICTYGMLGYRHGLGQFSWAPPGHDLTGSAPHDDWFRTIARTFDGQSPSFIPTNPGIPTGQDAPLLFSKQGYRYFTVPEVAGTYTEFSTAGYVIRQRPFTIQADALVSYGDYGGCLLDLTAINSLLQPQYRGTVGSGVNKKVKYELVPTQVEVLGTQFEGLAEEGFDNVTYFATQHLRGGVTALNSTRRIKMKVKGAGPSPTLSKTGPIDLSNFTGVADGVNFDLKPTADALDDTAQVLESATSRVVKAATLPAKNWTIGLYPADVYDAQTGLNHPGPNPPGAMTLEAALNDIFGKQANVTFSVELKPRIFVNTMTFSPAFPPYPPTVGAMKYALWNASGKEDLALFWVEQMEGTTLAQAFAIPSRGAVIGPGCSSTAIAHELGHCFGLNHCWMPNIESGMGKIADVEAKRVMGYAGGKLFRYAEIKKINKLDLRNVNPVEALPQP